MIELAQEAGFQDGVLNVVHGGRKAVDMILDSPQIKSLSFVGSNQAGIQTSRGISSASYFKKFKLYFRHSRSLTF